MISTAMAPPSALQPLSATSDSPSSPSSDSSAPTLGDSARARLYGEPVLHLPKDLYIPPDALEIFLEAFEGPLDLLLYLIRRQNFNILDIPMAQLTRQYLEYVEEVRLHHLELAAEYLLMAAMLIEIKSRLLLPAPASAEDEQEGDPRAELVRRLLEYEQIKQAAHALDALPRRDRDFQVVQVHIERQTRVRWPEVSVADLQAAWAGLHQRARLNAHHTISREELSVREHMSAILRQLQTRRFVEFSELFDPARGVPVLVVHFIALLELAKETLVDLTQAEAFAPIYVRLAYVPE